MAKQELTKRQEEVLEFIKQFILNYSYPPSVRDIGEGLHISSTSTVFLHLNALESKGYITRNSGKSRCIEIVDDSFQNIRQEMTSIPIVGTVAAGQPILAEENITGYFPMPMDMVPNSETFCLKVKGNSMINKGIFSGDQLFVEKTNVAHNGDTVVALVGDSATVKTFYKENGYIRLQPENDTMEPIIVEDCVILGKVFGVFRLYR